MLKLDLIQYFVTAAKTNSIHLAAEQLFVTQPTVSRGIKALEDELSIPLFLRQYDGVYLTPEGEKIFPIAVSLLESAEKLYKESLQLSNQKKEDRPQQASTTIQILVSSAIIDRFIPYLTGYICENQNTMKLKIISSSIADETEQQFVNNILQTQPNTVGIFLSLDSLLKNITFCDKFEVEVLATARICAMSKINSKYISSSTKKLTLKEFSALPLIMNLSDPTNSYIVSHLINGAAIAFDEPNLNLYLQYIQNDLGVGIATTIFENISPAVRSTQLIALNQGFQYTPLITPEHYKLVLVYNQAFLTEHLAEFCTLIKSMWLI